MKRRIFSYAFCSLMFITSCSLRAQDNAAPQGRSYKVAAGDTYYSIARRFKTSVKTLMELNDSRALRAGDVIILPVAVQESEEVTIHEVRPKETLFRIANIYSTSVEKLKHDNNLSSDIIKIGQKIVIKKHTRGEKKQAGAESKAGLNPLSEGTSQAKEQNAKLDLSQQTGPTAEPKALVPPPTALQPFPTPKQSIQNKDVIKRPGVVEAKPKTGGKKVVIKTAGVGVWINDSDLDFSKSVSLYNSAPIGTIIKVTNPMNMRSIYTKVIGSFYKNDLTKDAIIVISRSAATLLGIRDNRFRTELEYSAQK